MEAEWEKAARGTDERIYPWGNEFVADNCNTSESGTDGTRPVDAHPGGVSPYGVMDMAGNTWEWTTTYYQDDEESHILKGGAWDTKALKIYVAIGSIFDRISAIVQLACAAAGIRHDWIQQVKRILAE